jgi:hypothetical protein
MVLKN